MSNVTLSIPNDLLKEGREYAKRNNTSLNALIRNFLEETFQRRKKNSMEEFFALTKKHKVNSKGYKFRREDAYDI